MKPNDYVEGLLNLKTDWMYYYDKYTFIKMHLSKHLLKIS